MWCAVDDMISTDVAKLLFVVVLVVKLRLALGKPLKARIYGNMIYYALQSDGILHTYTNPTTPQTNTHT